MMMDGRPMKVSKARVDLPAKPHALYRFYDRTDVLLYVGITADLPVRMDQHRKGKAWWTEIHHITIEHFDTRAVALEAEKKAIREEGPLYNSAHNQLVEAPGVPADGQVDSDDAWKLGRLALAHEVVETIGGVLGDERLGKALAAARRDLALPDTERMHDWEYSEEVITALELVQAVAEDMWRFRFVTEHLLKAVPEHIRAYCEEEAAQEWVNATGKPAPERIDLLPDIIRYVGYVIRGRFDAPLLTSPAQSVTPIRRGAG